MRHGVSSRLEWLSWTTTLLIAAQAMTLSLQAMALTDRAVYFFPILKAVSMTAWNPKR